MIICLAGKQLYSCAITLHNFSFCSIVRFTRTHYQLNRGTASCLNYYYSLVYTMYDVCFLPMAAVNNKKASQQDAFLLLAPTIRSSIATRYQHWLVGGPQVNKLEQVSSLGHQMSLQERGETGTGTGESCTVRSHVWRRVPVMVMVMATLDPLPAWTE